MMNASLLKAWVKPVVLLGLGVSILIPVVGMPSRAEEAAPVSPSTATPKSVSFPTPKARLWLEQNQVLCFNVPVSDSAHAFVFKADPNFLQILMPPAALPGQSIGYIRVRPVKKGDTKLILDGASLNIEIVPEPDAYTLWQRRPEIVSPTPGSAVWGSFSVGVEQLDFGNVPNTIPPVLRLPNGQELVAQPVPGDYPGPHRRYAFTVDAQSLSPGTNSLRAVIRTPSREEISSEPVDVFVARPVAAAMLAGDCKDQVGTPPPLPDKPPEHPRGPYHPQPTFPDAQSGTGSIVRNMLYVSVTIPKDGVYGLMMRVRGDVGGDALPTLEWQVDNDARYSARSCRLATTSWQNIPVGTPISVRAGTHTLTLREKYNFGSVPQDIRQLSMARYELAPLDALAGTEVATSTAGSTMMMQGGAPTMAMQSMVSGASNAQAATAAGGFHVFFADHLQGKTIASEVQIYARTVYPTTPGVPPPQVDVLVNGHVAAIIRHSDPQFRLPVSSFGPGENKVRLLARWAGGQRAESVTESIYLPETAHAGPELPRTAYAFYPNDGSWDAGMRSHLNPRDENSPATFYSNGQSTLALPDALEGLYRITIEARGLNFKGLPSATLVLQNQGQETPIGEVKTGGNWTEFSLPPTRFPQGPKNLILRFADDNYVKGQGIRTLMVNTLRFEPASSEPLAKLPSVSIAYPSEGAKVGLADAVVAKVFVWNGAARADLRIDGVSQQLDLAPQNGFGPMLLPLLTRGLTPGIHHVQVQVTDTAGNVSQSKEVAVNVTGQDEVADGPYHRSIFLLNRFGYGPESDLLAQVLLEGPHAWLAGQLSEATTSPREQNEVEMQRALYPALNSVVSRALQQLICDPNPVRMRFLMWAENHFSTWITKDGLPAKAHEHQRFDDLGVAPFPTLLLASATSPAMLLYLDQRNSVSKHLNENYAREIMELHTLGVKGGYTQKDVTTLADLLTGWTVTDQAPLDGSTDIDPTFRYDPYLSSGTECEVLGMTFPAAPPEGRFDRVLTALEMLAAHPSCAHFICRQLAEQYVSDPAPPELVDHLSDVYLKTGGDLQAVLLSMLDEPAFWSADPKVATPIDFGVRLERLSGLTSPAPLEGMMRLSGMGLFDRFSPDGYPESDGYYSNSNALLQRWHFAQAVMSGFLSSGPMPIQGGPYLSPQSTPAAVQRRIDFASMRITGDVPSETTTNAALQLLASAPPNVDRVKLLTLFLCQSPETSLR